MATRLDLQNFLEQLLGSKNVYYQPPATLRMHYPAIVYKRDNIKITNADNNVYLNDRRYEITVIDADPDSEITTKLAQLPKCYYVRNFQNDNLNHDIFELYF